MRMDMEISAQGRWCQSLGQTPWFGEAGLCPGRTTSLMSDQPQEGMVLTARKMSVPSVQERNSHLVLQSQMAAWGVGRSQNRNVWMRPKSPIPTKSSRIRDRHYQIRISATVVLATCPTFRVHLRRGIGSTLPWFWQPLWWGFPLWPCIFGEQLPRLLADDLTD